jgi:acyl carrier protein
MVLYGEASCPQCSEPLWFLNLSSETRMFRQAEADEVKDRVRHIVADEMNISPDDVPTDWSEARELLVDSLDAIEILTMLEEEFSGKVVAGRIPHLRR